MHTRICTDCGTNPVVSLRQRKRYRCHDCTNKERKRQYAADRINRLAQARQYQFGITPDMYDALVTAQNGCCAICGAPETRSRDGITNQLAVDHDHMTGELRGLLCNRCNMGLGCLRESEAVLAGALAYIQVHRGEYTCQSTPQ